MKKWTDITKTGRLQIVGAVILVLVAFAAGFMLRGGKAGGEAAHEHGVAASGDVLLSFIENAVEPGSVICTDGWQGYSGVKARGYQHKATVLSGQGKDAALQELPRVRRIAGLTKRWLQGTHQGRVAPDHLDYYLDEYTFRFNRRTSATRGNPSIDLPSKLSRSIPSPIVAQLAGGPWRPNHNRWGLVESIEYAIRLECGGHL